MHFNFYAEKGDSHDALDRPQGGLGRDYYPTFSRTPQWYVEQWPRRQLDARGQDAPVQGVQ